MSRAENLTFSRRLFNPNYFHLLKEMMNHFRRFIFAYGGSSSAKTHSVVQAVLILGCLIEGSDTIVFRKVSNTIKKSIYKDFKLMIKNMGLESYFTVLDFQIRCYNGSVIDFSGVDDPEKIKGISNYKRVVLEELSEFDHADFKQVRKRLRGMVGQQIICLFNPIDIEHWIKTELFDKQAQNRIKTHLSDEDVKSIGFNKLVGENPEYTTITDKWEGGKVTVKGVEYPPNFVVLKSTYENNFWVVGSPCKTFGYLDFQTIADFELDKKEDYNYYCIYALGDWGKLNRGGEFYKKFSTEKHVAKVEYNPDRSLHLTFDENVNPYMTLDIHQGEGLTVTQIDEICLEDPKNTLSDTMKEFKRRYPPNGNTVYIYGDATSKKADVKLEKGKNFYTLVENYLRENNYIFQNRVPRSNPNVEVRGNWMNAIFGTGLDGIDIIIGDNCQKTISDYNYLKEASDGTKFKEKAKHPVTKVTYEKYGHNSDANDYFYAEFFKDSFNKFRNPNGNGQRSMTRKRIKKGY